MHININSTLDIYNGQEFIAQIIAPELTVDNPKYLEAVEANRSTWGINPVIKNFSVDALGTAHLPRGYKDRLIYLANKSNIQFDLVDKRMSSPIIGIHEHAIELRDYQYLALQELVQHTEGVLVSPAGSGKTVMGISLIIMSGQKALWITHTKELANQFIERAKQFITNLDSNDVGNISKGIWKIGDKITVSLVQTLIRSPEKLREISEDFGLIIVDECLDYDSRLTTKEYGKKKIGVIVNNKIDCYVKSFNKDTRIFEWKKIVRFFKNIQKEMMLNISFGYSTSITCTKNHSIYTFNNYNITKVNAQDLNIGDNVVIEKSFKTSGILTKRCKPLLLGMILGDGCLTTNNHSIRLRVTHGEKQLGYLNYKKALIKEIVMTKNGKGKSGYKSSNNIYNFNTLSFYDIDNWYNKIYVNGNKTHVPKELSKLLTIESWAIMYQDDGSISNGKYVSFSFCDFTIQAVKNLSKSLQSLLNIDSTIIKCNRGYLYLRLNKASSEKFILAIKNIVWPGLHYKLGIYNKNTKFKTINVPKIFENFSVLKVKNIIEKKATGGYRYNIEVEDNHNYLANNKLVGNCHHVPATTFTEVVNNLNPYYLYGLTATPKRRDNLQQILFQNIGPIRHTVPRSKVSEGGNIVVPVIRAIKLNTQPIDDKNYHSIIKSLVENENRNNRIVSDVVTEANSGNVCIVTTDRKAHAEILHEKLKNSEVKVAIITGAYSDKLREKALELLRNSGIDVLVCTTQLLGEGFDHAPLNRLFIGLPFRDVAKCEQLVGRLQRPHKDKENAWIFDYIDEHGLTKHQFRNSGVKGCRYNVYKMLGCEIIDM